VQNQLNRSGKGLSHWALEPPGKLLERRSLGAHQRRRIKRLVIVLLNHRFLMVTG
jgi:hypothetical protein